MGFLAPIQPTSIFTQHHSGRDSRHSLQQRDYERAEMRETYAPSFRAEINRIVAEVGG